MRFKYDGIPVRHIVTPKGHYLLLLTKDTMGQYTNLALLNNNYWAINIYFLDAYSRMRNATLRLQSSIDTDIHYYETVRKDTFESMIEGAKYL